MDNPELTALFACLAQMTCEQKRLITAIVEATPILPEDFPPLPTASLPEEFRTGIVTMRSTRLAMDSRCAEHGRRRKVAEVLAKFVEIVASGDPKGEIKCVGCGPSRARRLAVFLMSLLLTASWMTAFALASRRHSAWVAINRAEAPIPHPIPESP